MFKNNQKGTVNVDLLSHTRDEYLELTKDFNSSFDKMVVKSIDGFNVVDESKSCSVGFKARAAEFFVQNLVEQGVKEVVYVQPRRGFAGISLAYLTKKYGLDLTLVMPSSKEVSDHQALCIELGAKPLFLRVAAMPNANAKARKYAASREGAVYVPLGLKHRLVTAGAVRAIYDDLTGYNIDTMWSVISTGVLTRAMQIALPNTNFHAVAVARNIQDGELGRAKFYSYHKPFNSKSDLIPTGFDCEDSYDSKGWDVMNSLGNEGDWFFSVAGNADKPTIDKSTIDSYRDWNDMRDFPGL